MFLPPPRTVRRAALLLIILGLKAFSASGQTEPFKDEDEPLEGRTEQCFRAMSLFDNSTGLKDIVNLVLQGSNSGEMSSTSGSGSSSAAIVRNGNSSENEQFNNVTTIASEVEDVEDGIRVVPLFDTEMPLKISLAFYIEDLSSINEMGMDYRLDYYIEQIWKTNGHYCDLYSSSLLKRNMSLKGESHEGQSEGGRGGGGESGKEKGVKLKADYFSLFWIPDIFVTNAKSITMQSQTMSTQSLHIQTEQLDSQNKSRCVMKYTARLAAIMSCGMDFRKYPVDKQTCNITLRSFAYSDSDVVLEWKNVTEKGNLTLLEHEFKFSYSNTEEEVFRSNYSALSITVTLQRKISNKLAGVYIPALLIVIITFSTFWLGPHSLPDRVSIGITAFLAIVTMFSQARLQLPPISYVSEIDKWMLICMTFVAVQLFQATIVHFKFETAKNNVRQALGSKMAAGSGQPEVAKTGNPVDRVAKGRKCRTRSTLGDQLEVTSTESDDDGEDSDQGDDQCCKCCGLFRVDIASSDPAYGSMKMDSLSRVFVPLAFALFCAYYWPSLLKNA